MWRCEIAQYWVYSASMPILLQLEFSVSFISSIAAWLVACWRYVGCWVEVSGAAKAGSCLYLEGGIDASFSARFESVFGLSWSDSIH